MIRSVVTGCGSYSPERVMKNSDFPESLDTSDEWITQRTGIKQRHIAADGETTADLAEKAARAALEDAGMSVADLDMIILATATPDNTFPATSVEVQQRLGMNHGAAFDLQAVCSGFVFAITTADQYIRSGQAKSILVIGAETFSRILDWEDQNHMRAVRRRCRRISSAGLTKVMAPTADRGILTSHLRSDGAHKDKLYVDGGPSSTQTVGYLRMEGRGGFPTRSRYDNGRD